MRQWRHQSNVAAELRRAIERRRLPDGLFAAKRYLRRGGRRRRAEPGAARARAAQA